MRIMLSSSCQMIERFLLRACVAGISVQLAQYVPIITCIARCFFQIQNVLLSIL